ncbi:MAG: thioredoxin [Actinobacteria bacterium]|nr:thioredoxin [Actinomycetota bacterium]MBV9255379.1 thioredoxin [Actinomycetota bacterium]
MLHAMTAPASQIVECANCGKKNRVPATASGTPRCGNCKAPLPWIADADDPSFAEVVERAALPVLLDLWAPWCGPCKMVSPALEQLARSHAGQIKLVKVNVDMAPQVAARFEARSIPTLLVLDHGRVIAEKVGAAPESALRSWLDDALASSGRTHP